MTDPGRDRNWSAGFVAAIVGIVGFAFLMGFVLVPIVQGRAAGIDAWTAFCRAAGLLPGSPAVVQPVTDAQARPVSQVAWGPDVLQRLGRADLKAGEAVARQTCAACHGERGLSPSEQFPHLSGQSAAAIYKQLHDFRTGARTHPMMTPVAQNLGEEQMIAVAAYFARGNSFRSLGHVAVLDDYEMNALANQGRPNRGIPACNSCHGGGVGGPIETPTLVGQRRSYLEAQLKAYAAGSRGNDVYARMRTIAHRMTAAEISAMAEYYAGLPIPAP